jgi:methyl-accepting chemotaxis protein
MADEDDIVQRVRIEGEEDLLTVFASIGAAGKQAFEDIKDAGANVGSSFRTLQNETRRSFQTIQQGGNAAEFGLRKIERAATAFGNSIREAATTARTSLASVASAIASITRVPPLPVLVNAFKVAFSSIRNIVQSAMAGVNQALQRFSIGNITANLRGAEAQFRRFGGALREVGQGAVTFARRTALSFAGIGVAAVAFRQLASQATGAAAAQRSAAREATAAINDAKGDTQALAGINQQAAEAAAQLNRQFGQGKISLEDYTQGLQDLQEQQQANIRQFLANDAAEEQARKRQLESMKKLKEQESFDAVASKVGNQAASAFLQLGNTIDQVINRLQQILGPTLSQIVTGINTAIQQNMPQIIAFIEEIKQRIAPLGKDIPTAFKDAMPGVFEFVRGFVDGITLMVDAVQTLIKVLDGVADVINGIFGTNFSGASLAAIAIILSMSGAFAVIIPLLKAAAFAFGLLWTAVGLGPAILIVVAAALLGWLIGLENLKKVWDGLVVAFKVGWALIKGFFTGGIKGAIDEFNKLDPATKKAAQDMVKGIQAAIMALPNWIGQRVTEIKNKFNELVTGASATGNGIAEAFRSAWATIVENATSAVEQVKGLVAQINDAINQDLEAAQRDPWAQLTDWANRAIDGVKQAFESLKSYLNDVWEQIKAAARDAWEQIPQGLKDLISGIGGLLGFAGGGLVGGYAEGGKVRGRGTGTSDSILARLSNGEFVQRTAAVRHYGVNFMNAINNLKFPKDLLQGFATGGLVGMPSLAPTPILSFADGGAVDTPRNALTLVLDGESFGGLLAQDDVFEGLKKKAVKKSLSPRKPNWF